MSHISRIGTRIAGVTTAAVLAAGAVAGIAPTAHAYKPNPTTDPGPTRKSTDRSSTLIDPIDNTYFHKDPGGYSAKIELRQGRHYVGKVEFHPYGEKLFIYDTRDDGDSFYLKVQSPGSKIRHFEAPTTRPGVDVDEIDLDYDEGKPVYITVYDNSDESDELAMVTGNA